MKYRTDGNESAAKAAKVIGGAPPTSDVLRELRAKCPLPILLKRMGLGQYAKKSCRSPFRTDTKASWGIFQRNDRWFWKDHGTGDHGDEISFIVRAKKYPPQSSFGKAVDYWHRVASQEAAPDEELPVAAGEALNREKPNRSGFGPGTDDQLMQLSKARKIDPVGLVLAQMKGLLVFGRFWQHEVYGITDGTGHLLELRRLDGQLFAERGDLKERKCHTVKGSRKDWPVGLCEVGQRPSILLVEGGPDLLAACEVIAREGAIDRVAPVTMLSAGAAIAADALPYFKGKHVRILPHNDEPGRNAAARWKEQMIKAGAAKVDFLLLCSDEAADSTPFKDLNDYLPLYRHEMSGGSTEGRLL